MGGKASLEDLRRYVFNRTGAEREDVKMGPKYGEDTGAVNIGEQVLVVNSDPIVYAADRIGLLGVNIASNDIAASGAEPKWLTNTIFLPDNNEENLNMITKQISDEAERKDISIIGGHSEYVEDISRPIISMTCLGTTDNYISTSGADPGDLIILTKGAGIEGTGIIATDFKEEIRKEVSQELINKAEDRLDDLSVLDGSRVLRNYATSMHDPTEGGLIDGLLELANASDVELRVKRNNIIVPDETRELCSVMGVDPLKIFSSGALLATVPKEKARKALRELVNIGIDATVIGEVESGSPKLDIDGEIYEESIKDDLYSLWE